MPRMQMNLALILGDIIYESMLDVDADTVLSSKGAMHIESALAASTKQLTHKLAEKVAKGRNGNGNIYGLGPK